MDNHACCVFCHQRAPTCHCLLIKSTRIKHILVRHVVINFNKESVYLECEQVKQTTSSSLLNPENVFVSNLSCLFKGTLQQLLIIIGAV